MKKILVVDDETIMLTLANNILAPFYEVVIAHSGQEALRVYEDEMPDLVLMDVFMPEMSGYEAVNILQERYGKEIPVIFVSADDREDGEKEGLNNGAIDYIRKPYRSDVLLRRIEIAMQNQTQIQGLKKVAGTDPMTGFFNKASTKEAIDASCAQGEYGMLLLLDLDNFKMVNDICGHSAGDQILLRFAELVRQITRTSDVVGRIGGDEFIIFFHSLPSTELIGKRCNFLNEGLNVAAKEYLGEDNTIPLGCSIGAVATPEEGKDYQTLVQKAEQALSAIKENGTHGFAFYGAGENSKSEIIIEDENSIKNIVAQFDEKDRMPGAYEVSTDQFSPIFQVMHRIAEQYGRNIHLLMITLKRQDGVTKEISDYFRSFLISHLRRSDVVMQYDDNRVLLMLPDTAEAGSKFMLRRIETAWITDEKSQGSGFTVEMMDIRK